MSPLDAPAELLRGDPAWGSSSNGTPRASHVVVLDPDVAAVFPDAETVNSVLRALAKIILRRRTRRPGAASR